MVIEFDERNECDDGRELKVEVMLENEVNDVEMYRVSEKVKLDVVFR